VTPAVQAILDQGTAVGVLAQDLHPGGVLVEADHRHPGEAVATTRRLLDEAQVPALFEAGFQHQGVLARVDLLVRQDTGGWALVEVKASTHCKPVFALDAALQYWVLMGCGVPVDQVSVLTLNADYRYDGAALDLATLFKAVPQTGFAKASLQAIEAEVMAQQAMLAAPEPPAIRPGPQCSDPYACPYFAACTQAWPRPEHPVEELPRLGAKVWSLRERGIWSIPEVPRGEALTRLQARVRTAVSKGRPWVSRGLGKALRAFKGPIHHLDFETIAPAVPRFAGSGPFQAVPVQWSCHREEADGRLVHTEFLAADGAEPREAFARTLLATLGATGSICVYSSYEQTILRRLARDLPHLAPPLLALLDRIVDLLGIVREHCYLPGFHGSYSIKRVLPALVPGFSYAGLEVGDGTAAALAFERMLGTPDPAEALRLRQALLVYCGQDTLAMVEVRRALGRLAKRKPARAKGTR
jgi:hypothetical protein